jgi:hypothetical protein
MPRSSHPPWFRHSSLWRSTHQVYQDAYSLSKIKSLRVQLTRHTVSFHGLQLITIGDLRTDPTLPLASSCIVQASAVTTTLDVHTMLRSVHSLKAVDILCPKSRVRCRSLNIEDKHFAGCSSCERKTHCASITNINDGCCLGIAQ